MKLAGLSQVLLLDSYLVKIDPKASDHSLGPFFLQVLVDCTDSFEFFVFQLAESMYSCKVHKHEKPVS